MILDLNAPIDHVQLAEAEYTRIASEIQSYGGTAAQLCVEYGLTIQQFVELAAIVAVAQQMIEASILQENALLPSLTLPSVLAAELYVDFCDRHDVPRSVFRKGYALALNTLMVSAVTPGDGEVESGAAADEAITEPEGGDAST